ncbi:hypothetical protein PRIPAC_80281 [Pristionchus pacificus]|uniref:Uncharacterized protein n=1 Tax=Pristionchus pacificus TaxID=54126 RepID=A0A2A6CK56_PRIPA|nr:hypothetical protein PRIPAC_80281 [Pristionchus pacificus]|eukprot:PDM78490.1 hypothetical protein PRIPAC_31069 [Pristionchus pacificus]
MPASNYAHAKTGGFTIEAPHAYNSYRDDPVLDRTLKRLLKPDEYERTSKDLDRFSQRILDEIGELGRQCELKKPELVVQDAWGKRVDELRVCDEWNTLKRIFAEEGLIAIGYDKSRDAVARRLHQTVKIALFNPAAGLTGCPLAMTDGAVRTFEALGLEKTEDPELKEAYERLLSTDGQRAWTSGQWMTEKRGGSDVSGACDTYATHVEGDKYLLNGYKWFSSAVDANIALTLARIVDENGKEDEKLSLFFLHVRKPGTNELNGIQMIRLKDKLGTRQLPTAELLLDGVKARMLGERGRGIAAISNMLNGTRLVNACGSVSAMRSILNLARDYSTRREAFGRRLDQWPLHLRTIAELEVDARACTLFLLDVAFHLGLQESGRSSEYQTALIRLMTPVLKAYTAKLVVPHVSEALECFGGMGYMEDSGIPSSLRDAQVMPIWEGTTNVLSMDVMRVMSTRPEAVDAFENAVTDLVEPARVSTDARIRDSVDAVKIALEALVASMRSFSYVSDVEGGITFAGGARSIMMALGRVYCGALLINNAIHPGANESDFVTAKRFCLERSLLGNLDETAFGKERNEQDRLILFNHTQNQGWMKRGVPISKL